MTKRRARREPKAGPVPSCPCGSAQVYGDCCGRLHQGRASASTAERLMRSRFSAFAVGDADYLLRTWHSSTRPARLALDPGQRWTRLDLVDTERGGVFDAEGTVEFRAHYRAARGVGELRERSRFVREDGHWAYLGALPPDRPASGFREVDDARPGGGLVDGAPRADVPGSGGGRPRRP